MLVSVLASTRDAELRETIEAMLVRELTRVQHPSLCLERLTRYVAHSRVPSTLLSQWERDPDLLSVLLPILDLDTSLVETLILDPDGLQWMQQWDRPGVAPGFAADLLLAEVKQLDEESQVQSALLRFQRREWLRAVIAWKLQDQPYRNVQRLLSDAATAILQSAYEFAFRERRVPSTKPGRDGTMPPLCILGLGEQGSGRGQWNQRWELLCVCDASPGPNANRDSRPSELEAWDRKLGRMIELLESLAPGTAAIEFPLQWEFSGLDGRIVDARAWLDTASVHGSALHRVTLLGARPIAGDAALGRAFLDEAMRLVYPKYASRSDIASLSSYLRCLDRASRADGDEDATGLSARIEREIVSLVHFLQLIHGCELPEVRDPNPENAIDLLHREGCLTGAEHLLLAQSLEDATKCQWQYQLSQIRSRGERESLPSQRGTNPHPLTSHPQRSWIDRLRESVPRLEQMTRHLRREVFDEEELAEEGLASGEEADLILDPAPAPDWAASVLSRYHFQDIPSALKGLQDLAVEEVRVLSTQRCRYFLSMIARRLLDRIGQTPSPDATLQSLVTMCRSIGAKGVLWELFSMHQPSLELVVRLCGASPYLVGILTSNPGMIDELLDSLMLGRLPSESQLSKMLAELCRGADQIDAIVQSFKNTMHLNIGVRDILGKENVTETHRALSDVADVCLQQTIEYHYNALVKRYGVPTQASGDACRFGVLGLGKLGCREPNYHSDVTILIVYEAPGETRPLGPVRHHQAIGNEDFFHQLAQRIAQGVNRVTRYGRLFELQNWNWSGTPSSHLAWEWTVLSDAFRCGSVPAASRQLLATARVIAGDASFHEPLTAAIHSMLRDAPWTEQDTRSALAVRKQLEQTANRENLKRGPGGTLDIETLAQILALQQIQHDPQFAFQGTIDTLEQLRRAERLPADDALHLKDAYNFLRGVESGLRLMNTKARHDLPKDPMERKRLAYGLHIPDADQLIEVCEHYRHIVRACFLRAFPEYALDPVPHAR